MHVGSVELRSMFGKNVIVDLAVYVTLNKNISHKTGPIRPFVLPEEDSDIPHVLNS